MEFTRIILAILLRHAPAQALVWAVAYLIDWAVGTLEDEDHRLWIEESPKNAQWFGGWLAFIEAVLDALILFKAWKGLGKRWPGRRIPPWAWRPLPSVRTLSDCLDRLTLIAARFADRDRLASRRRDKLARLFEAQDPLGRTDHRPAGAAPFIPLSPDLRPCAVLARALPDQRIRAPP